MRKFVFGVDSIANLSNLTPPSDGTVAIVSDSDSETDGYGGVFIGYKNATDTIDGGIIVRNNSGSQGRWFRQYEEMVNVKWFGAKGDGTTDDTDAIIHALKVANNITTDWETTGDDYINPPYRIRKAVYFPHGIYKVTRSIPINFRGVSIVGPEGQASDRGGDYQGGGAQIFADHDDDVFALNAAYNCSFFFMKNITIKKFDSLVPRSGIALTGANWQADIYLQNVIVMFCDNGVYMDISGSGSCGYVIMNGCQFSVNENWGIDSYGGMWSNSEITNCSIVQNGVGGIRLGGFGLNITTNDFEGQPNPICITASTNSQSIVIENNYVEQPLTTNDTRAVVTLFTTHGFRIQNNIWHILPEGLPKVACLNCSNGEIDCEATLSACFNVLSRQLYITDENVSPTYWRTVASCYDLSFLPLPAGKWDDAFQSIVGSAGTNIKIGEQRYIATECTPWRHGFSMSGYSYADGDYLFLSFAVKYTNTLPTAPFVQITAGSGTLPAPIEVSFEGGFDGVKAGETIIYNIGIRVLGGTMVSPFVYIYPYALAEGSYSGGYITKAIASKAISSNPVTFPYLNPLELLTGELESIVAWTPGEIDAYGYSKKAVYVAGSSIGDYALAQFYQDSLITLPDSVFLNTPNISSDGYAQVKMFNMGPNTETITAGQLKVRIFQRN